MAIGNRIKNIWNAFLGRDPTPTYNYGYASSQRPDRGYTRYGPSDRSIVNSIYNQIAVDCAAIDIKHVRLDEDEKYKETIDDSLNDIFTRRANVDQTGRAFIEDCVESLLNEGVIAIIPVETDGDPNNTDSYKILSARVGKIVEWFPQHVRVEAYDERTGQRKQIILAKRYTPVVQNPFYTTMNQPNSTTQRLIRILSQLDKANATYNPNKLDMIVQLPYLIRSEAREKQAEKRRKSIEEQLSGSNMGIAYTDGTEKIIQLNRSLENNLWAQAKDLTDQLYNMLGLSKAIFDGTADEAVQLNYYNRTIEPIMSAIIEEMTTKWISKTASSQGQSIKFYRNPFKLVPVINLAEIADKMTRNEIMSSNEFRSIMGLKPDDNPKSDMLINSNLNQPEGVIPGTLDNNSDKGVSEKKEGRYDFKIPESVKNKTI